MRALAAKAACGAVYVTAYATFWLLRAMIELILFLFPIALGYRHQRVRRRNRW